MGHVFLSLQYSNWIDSSLDSVPMNHPLKNYWFASRGNLFIVAPLIKKQYEIEVLFPDIDPV